MSEWGWSLEEARATPESVYLPLLVARERRVSRDADRLSKLVAGELLVNSGFVELLAQMPEATGSYAVQKFMDSGLAEAILKGLGVQYRRTVPATTGKDGLRRASGPGSFESVVQEAKRKQQDAHQTS